MLDVWPSTSLPRHAPVAGEDASGTVRQPPGVKVSARRTSPASTTHDVWLPVLAPSAGLVAAAPRRDDRASGGASSGYVKEMSASDPAGVLDLLALLSSTVDLAIGCYCGDGPATVPSCAGCSPSGVRCWPGG